jgi:hypothetical protein
MFVPYTERFRKCYLLKMYYIINKNLVHFYQVHELYIIKKSGVKKLFSDF